MENKEFIRVETARKTQEQIDIENTNRDKNLQAKKTKKTMGALMIVVGLCLLIIALLFF